MYFARGIRDLLQTTELNLDFFNNLDDFQINFIEMCFKQSLDEKMGLMGEIEKYNYHLFEEYKMRKIEDMYGVDPDYFKRSA